MAYAVDQDSDVIVQSINAASAVQILKLHLSRLDATEVLRSDINRNAFIVYVYMYVYMYCKLSF